jgi:hypothetical protein
MLALMCRAYQERCLAFPTRRVNLHDRCLRGLLHDWKKEEKGEEGISASSMDAVIELLQKAAYSLFLEGKEQFRESELRKKLLAAWPELPLVSWLRDQVDTDPSFLCDSFTA